MTCKYSIQFKNWLNLHHVLYRIYFFLYDLEDDAVGQSTTYFHKFPYISMRFMLLLSVYVSEEYWAEWNASSAAHIATSHSFSM